MFSSRNIRGSNFETDIQPLRKYQSARRRGMHGMLSSSRHVRKQILTTSSIAYGVTLSRAGSPCGIMGAGKLGCTGF